MPPLVEFSIRNKIDVRQVVRTRLRQLPGDLGGDAAASWTELVDVVFIHPNDHANRIRIAKSVSKGREVEIVAGRVAHQAEPRLDPSDLGQGWYSQDAFPDRYFLNLQRQSADEIPNPGIHTVETSKDELWPLDSCGDPTLCGLEVRQNVVEAIAQVLDDVVVIERNPMSGVVCRRGITDQDGVRHQLLQPGSGLEYALHFLGLHGNSDYNHYSRKSKT